MKLRKYEYEVGTLVIYTAWNGPSSAAPPKHGFVTGTTTWNGKTYLRIQFYNGKEMMVAEDSPTIAPST